MARKKDSGKVIKSSKSVVVRMSEEMIKHLKKACLSMSVQRGSALSLSELIRETMMQYCPSDKQLEFFEKETRKRK